MNRGGSYYNNAGNCESSNVNSNDPDNRNYNLGFRVALVPVAQEKGWISRIIEPLEIFPLSGTHFVIPATNKIRLSAFGSLRGCVSDDGGQTFFFFLMQYKFFSIPATGGDASSCEEEMNAFLRAHRILTVRRELVTCGAESFWACCVEYLLGNGAQPNVSSSRSVTRTKIDYREVLSEADFEKFRLLRECRKKLAEEEGVPAYAIFLDEQLADLARSESQDVAAMKKISGVGEKKAEKYGALFFELFEKLKNEKDGKSV